MNTNNNTNQVNLRLTNLQVHLVSQALLNELLTLPEGERLNSPLLTVSNQVAELARTLN